MTNQQERITTLEQALTAIAARLDNPASICLREQIELGNVARVALGQKEIDAERLCGILAIAIEQASQEQSDQEFFCRRIMQAIEKDSDAAVAKGVTPDVRPEGKYLVRDLLDAISAVDNTDDARRFFRGYVDYLTGVLMGSDPMTIARSNIGWALNECRVRQQLWRHVWEAC